MRLLLAVVLVGMLGMAALGWQTRGFTIVTTESARRGDVARERPRMPDVVLQRSDGQATTLWRELALDGRVAIVNFIYTRCVSICLAMGTEFQQLQDALRRTGLDARVRLISISFDGTDTPERLARYDVTMRADPHIWRTAVIDDARMRQALLDAFGIVVVPAPMGDFVHNAAYHVVTADGRLIRIVDIGDLDGLLRYVSNEAVHDKAPSLASVGSAAIGTPGQP
ncbi:SCO family protein [Parapusillimonas sp. SGNA-6]|nr:SCO family protein [Parapusillimonas sp. SGNA-6]